MGATVPVRRRRGRTLAALAIPGLLAVAAVSAGQTQAAAPSTAPAVPPDDTTTASTPSTAAVDDLPNPQEEKRRELREAALTAVLNGDAVIEQRGPSTVVNLGGAAADANARASTAPAEDQYVELARETTDKILVVLAEFGNERHPDYPDQDTDPDTPGPARFDGPLHNEIPEPDRTVDNSTNWMPDYSKAHYEELYFGTDTESLKRYYERQSSGRYSVDGAVSDWVKVRYNEARYGRSDGFPCGSNVCDNTWNLIKDALDTLVADSKAAGVTDEQIAAEAASYDQWDRNDYDNDGDFNEPDGYIDHFQIVHAGGDQADGDPWQGEDAIWSHRWKAFQGHEEGDGPSINEDGGVEIGTSGIWVADYTIQPENGGLSVFAHEYGHDLGLPDMYDTAGGENSVNWWSIMAQSRVSAPGDVSIDSRAADMGPWEKLQLGWLDYEIVLAGDRRTLELGPHEYNSAKAQAAVVVLPKKQIETDFGAPSSGDLQWWSDTGDGLENTMTRTVAIPAGTAATLSFQARYNIEDCDADDDPEPTACDYAFVEVNDGTSDDWTPIPGSITIPEEGNGIDGVQEDWIDATFDVSAYAGSTIGVRIRYSTDGAAAGTDPSRPAGIFVDDTSLTVDGTVVFEDDAESDDSEWALDGFILVGASETVAYDNYYIASNRQYVSFDKYLRSGPYNFGFAPARPDWVEHFPYQDGLLVWYWDTSYSDNNTSQHPGGGEILPIDSHPQPIYRLDGTPWRGRIQGYDATFSLEKADSFTLHFGGRASYIRGQAAVPLFDDTREYWSAAIPRHGVILPGVGVRIRVLDQTGTSMRIRIAPS